MASTSLKQAQETLHLLGVPRLAEPLPLEVDSESDDEEPRCDFCNRTHDEVMYEDDERNAWNGETGCCKKCEDDKIYPFPTLPFDLVSRIIKEADGGRYTNKLMFDKVVEQLSGPQIMWWDTPHCEMNAPWSPWGYAPGEDEAMDRLVIWLDNTEISDAMRG